MKSIQLTEPADKHNVDAVLQVSIFANENVYNEIRRDSGMCDALRKLMKDESADALAEAEEKGMEKGLEKGMEKGLEKGVAKGIDHAILSSVRNLMDTMKWTAEQAMDAIKIPSDERSKYVSKL